MMKGLGSLSPSTMVLSVGIRLVPCYVFLLLTRFVPIGHNNFAQKENRQQIMNLLLNPKRTVAELKELRALTGDENGAQRVAFTPMWVKTREWLKQKLSELPLETHTDAAGNLWSTLRGQSEKCLLIGGHMDSVPNGGWLDGCLNVMAGVEILRRINAQHKGKPPFGTESM